MNDTFMKEKPILGLVLSMSLPMVLSMLVNSLYNIVDSYFVASISEEAMTALSLVYPIQNLINAITIGFGVGINATIAFYRGAQRKEQADRAASVGFFITGDRGRGAGDGHRTDRQCGCVSDHLCCTPDSGANHQKSPEPRKGCAEPYL